MPEFGKTLIIIGVLLAVIGFVMIFGPKIPYLGRLPGDIVIRRENFIFYFPLATSIIISIILTIIFSIFRR
ncbi:DUF2905 domain-containing protein [Dissulfurimicrobium hydrothermale]|nr:DUF2905 domain-containing protein [Dissulfurimicrobium hydrothermale]UKL14615.1 DUF2905 domain-containing protein [Dissulfurimicrobium hydrothermale]